MATVVYDPWITGAAQPKLTSERLGSIPLPSPPKPEIVSILNWLNERLEKIDTLVTRVSAGLEKLAEYRTALISAAVTGKIDVRGEAE